ncbi:MAG: hypothetical protein HYY91_04325 [Candidatus Omnitrophica bacterium]|nr:hypothetical protein [Candidatus Omnitrophota bacterium]
MSHPLYLAFVWHMHQPYYRDSRTGECRMPWVRLHGTKDYLDMVQRLESFPSLHQTFNLVPSLLDQLEEYLPPHNRSDQFLDLSRKPAADLTEPDKRWILERFYMADWEHMIKPQARYHDLLVKRATPSDDAAWQQTLRRFKTQDYLDLQVWFNLAWIDPWLRSQDADLARLEEKGGRFTEADKQLVLDKQIAILAQVIPAYRQAQQRGQIELTTSPYYHPIMPLLCDIRSAHAALPHLPLPEETRFQHPEDARWHLAEALQRHAGAFGRPATGVWPPEGSVSEEFVRLAIDAGVNWIATDEEILWRTLKTARAPSLLYRPHLLRRAGGHAAIVFRDRELSDLLGFVYSQWKVTLAVQDFLARLEGIHRQFRQEPQPALVSVILDGENAWEHYPRDAHDFLLALYQALAGDPRIRVVTVSEFLSQYPVDQQPSLPDLFAGSWIDGNFATWVGHPEKNAAWTLLAKARQDLAAAREAPPPHGVAGQAPAEAWRSLYIAEGSDWMWWYGDTHYSAQSEEFDALCRANLENVYRALGQEPPAVLQQPIKGRVLHYVSEPTAEVHPAIDGLETTYYEWLFAGYLDLRKGYAAIHRGRQLLLGLFYGFDQTHAYFRVDVDAAELRRHAGWRLALAFPDQQVDVIIEREAAAIRGRVSGPSFAPGASERPLRSSQSEAGQAIECAYQRIVEAAVPRSRVPLAPGTRCQLQVSLSEGAEVLERHPTQGTFHLSVPPADLESQVWSV